MIMVRFTSIAEQINIEDGKVLRQQEEGFHYNCFLFVMLLFSQISFQAGFFLIGRKFKTYHRVRKETGEDSDSQILPDVEIILQEFLLCLVATPHMIAATLVGDELPVGLHHHGVEVLHAVQDVGGHGVAGSEWQCVLDQTLNNE